MTTKELEKHIEEIKQLRQSGKLIKDIAKIYNTSPSTMGRLLRSNGEQTRIPLSQKEIDNMILEYANGKSINELVSKRHISSSTLSAILKENHIRIKSSGEINRKYIYDEKYFDEINTPNKAYILGLIYADGNLSKRNVLSISLQERDKDILEKIILELQSNHPLKLLKYNDKNPKWQNQYCLRISNRHMAESLKKHGVTPNKSLSIVFPDFLPKELFRHFIRGYFDGDGCINSNPKEKRISLISTEKFCLSIKDILKNELGIHCSISYCHDTSVPTRCLGIAGRIQVKKFLDYLYQNSELFLQRKYDLYYSIYCQN